MSDGAKPRARLIAAVAAIALVAAFCVSLIAAAGENPDSGSPDTASTDAAAVDARFAALSSARTNRCDLGAAELKRMPDSMRLQGSCCNPMDEARYRQQLREVQRLGESRAIPADPYDISVTLAKRLLGYRQISLDAHERAIYERARELSELGGPCCCPCWRWQAFAGQARRLITRNGWSATQVARLWDAEDGCGGPAEQA